MRTAIAGFVLAAGLGLLAAPGAVAGVVPGRDVPGVCIRAPNTRCVSDWAGAVAGTIPDPVDRAAAFLLISEANAVAGRTEAAREHLAAALGSAGEIGGDRDILRPWTKRFDDEIPYLRAEILTTIAGSQAALDDPERARETLSLALAASGAIRSDYWRAQRLVSIARVQAAAGALAEARQSVARADAGGEASSFGESLRECALAQARAGDFEGAIVSARTIRSDSLRDSTLADIAGLQARVGDDEGALVTVERIEKPYFRMLATYHRGTSLAEKGDIEEAARAAVHILEIRQGAAGQLLGRDTEILYSDTLAAIAKEHVATGAYEEAFSLARTIPDPLSIVVSLEAVATAQISAGALDAARDSAEAICVGRHPRYGDDCVRVLAALATAYATASDRQAASEIIARAARIAGQIIYYPDRSLAFAAIWKARTHTGDAEGARRAFGFALEAAADTDDVKERRHELVSLASTAARMEAHEDSARAFSAALAAAMHNEDPGLRATELAKTAAALARAAAPVRARKVFSEALATAASITNDPFRSVAVLGEIASLLAGNEP